MYVGPIVCPNCESPISSDASICPYCYSTAPMSAPWKQGSWGLVALIGFLAALALVSDRFLGTHLLQTAWEFLRKGP